MRASVSFTREAMKPESCPGSEQGLDSAVNLVGPLITSSSRHRWLSNASRDSALRAVPKEVVEVHVLLTRSLFACGILRRLLQRVSLAKPTSAGLRFW